VGFILCFGVHCARNVVRITLVRAMVSRYNHQAGGWHDNTGVEWNPSGASSYTPHHCDGFDCSNIDTAGAASYFT
jgi:hypothetical protein